MIPADTKSAHVSAVRYPSGEPIQFGLYPSLDPNKARIERTKAGLLLLIIGVIIAALVASFFWAFVLLTGAVLIILGRGAFDKKHQSYAVWSVLLYIVGLSVAGVSGLWFGISSFLILNSAPSSSAAVEALSSAYYLFLIGIFAAEAIATSCYVLLTYALQNPFGRRLLLVAYAVGLGLDALLYSLTVSRVGEVAQEAFSSRRFDPASLANLPLQAEGLGLLRLIPALFYASAYYLVWSSIRTGKIPVTP